MIFALRLLRVLLIAAFSTPLMADCGDDAENLLQGKNCDFDSNPAGNNGWSSSPGTLSYNTTDGFPTPGSARLAGDDLGGFFAGNLQAYGSTSQPTCVTVNWDGSDATATAGIYLRQVSGSPSCNVIATFFPGAGVPFSPCAGTAVATCTAPATPGGSWALASCNLTGTDSPAAGITYVASCSSDTGAFAVDFDNAFVRPGTNQMPVELQSFSIDD